MKQLASVLLVAALIVAAVPMPAAAPPTQLLYSVDKVTATRVPGGIRVEVEGKATTPGWIDIHLVLKSSTGGKLVYNFVGKNPGGIAPQVLSRVTATKTWKGTKKIKSVTVHAKTNQKTTQVQ
ncbi:MAG: hypothetical protein M3Q69_08580 [Acidobacteriota bacterium]|nr:hypothetical protein [Acidobacteriota bacterium]